MVECYKLIHNCYDLHAEEFFEHMGESITRGHNFKLKTKYARTENRKKFFTVRCIPVWNKLPEDIVNAPSLNIFKKTLDCLWAEKQHLFD